jgi:hypothetical protein
MKHHNDIPEQPLWYKDAIFYEVRVRSFYDASGDGIGDFAGLTQKLDYLRDLGVTALWLLPFYPSPLRDDGYDISDYMDVHPDCGSIHEFKTFLREAHRRGLRVITECPRTIPLVIFSFGVIRQNVTLLPALSFRILSRQTGRGIQKRRPITGIVSIPISRI